MPRHFRMRYEARDTLGGADTEAIELLLEAGADPHISDQKENTARYITWASCLGKDDRCEGRRGKIRSSSDTFCRLACPSTPATAAAGPGLQFPGVAGGNSVQGAMPIGESETQQEAQGRSRPMRVRISAAVNTAGEATPARGRICGLSYLPRTSTRPLPATVEQFRWLPGPRSGSYGRG